MRQRMRPHRFSGSPRTTGFRPRRPSVILLIAAALVFAFSHNTVAEASCSAADLTGDGTVGVDDLFILLEHWGECPKAEPCPDLTGDSAVGIDDLFFLLSHWDCTVDQPVCCKDVCEFSIPGPCGCWCDPKCFVFDDCCHDVCDWCDYDECEPDPEITGACCFFTNCQDLTPDECSKQYGFYAGDHTECSGEPVCPMDIPCAGYCGEQSPVGCWCDEHCFQFGDCCDNICETCGHFGGCA